MRRANPTYEDLYNENQRLMREAQQSGLLFRQIREDAADIKRIAENAFRARRHLLWGFGRLADLHARIYHDGGNWCRECRSAWPCTTQMMIDEILRTENF